MSETICVDCSSSDNKGRGSEAEVLGNGASLAR